MFKFFNLYVRFNSNYDILSRLSKRQLKDIGFNKHQLRKQLKERLNET